MRRAWMAFAAAGLVAVGFGAGLVVAQDMGGEKKAGEGEAPKGPSAEEMAAWQKYMTPSEAHQKMAASAGDWTTTGKMWMDPSAPPTELKGSAKFRMVLGGRFQVQEYTGDMMGMPFEGFGIGGYDNATKKYSSLWMDSMGTGMMFASGTADDKGVVTQIGKMSDPRGIEYDIREVIAHKDADTMTFELHMKGPDTKGEQKVMELTYTRKK